MKNTLTKKQKKSLGVIIVSVLLLIICKLIPFDKFGEYHKFIEIAAFFVPYIICGATVLEKAFRNILSGRVFDENFLMAVATIGALCLGFFESEHSAHAHGGAEEAAMVVILYRIGTLFESIAAERSRRSVKALTDIMPQFANVEREGKIITLSPEEVSVGEIIVVKAGERIPLDGKIIEGSGVLDTSALTGESTPLSVTVGDKVISGSISGGSVLRVLVESEYQNSTVGKILELIENAATKKAKTENFITRFAAVYTPAIVLSAVLVVILPSVFGLLSFTESLYRALNFLVISCPCALVISVPLSFFGGMGAASKRGVLIKGAVHLENYNKMKYCLFDKTGTLTNGSFKVTAIHPEKITEAELLRISAAAESFSNHPISLSLVSAYGKVPHLKVENVHEFSGEGISAKVDGKNVLIGNEKLMTEKGVAVSECDECKHHKHLGSTIHIAVENEYMGHIVISDQIKAKAKETVLALKKMGVTPIMLSGDNEKIANLVAKEVGIEKVYSGLLPADKVKVLEKIKQSLKPNEKVSFVGDGINDAPALISADVGISMGAAGSDAAIEAADIVIMDDAVEKLIAAKKIARKTLRIVRENIISAIGIKIFVLLLGAFTEIPMALAIFADVGVTILATLNATRTMVIGKCNCKK